MIFADLDNTICESRQKISKEMKKVLSKLDLIVISGASREQMKLQLDGLKCEIMAQSGNDTSLWQNKLNKKEIIEIENHIHKFSNIYPDQLENRGCQIAFSFVGHHAEIENKKAFDPTRKIRKTLLKRIPFQSKTLICKVAGTTCLDYTKRDGTKGKNIEKWIKEKRLKKKDCVYFGDALFKGGNDESVKGVIKCVEVANPTDLLLKLKKYE